MFEFTDLKFERCGGMQARVDFANGYGISVIRDGYGHEQGLYELAVVKLTRGGAGWTVCYDTPVTNGVEKYLTPDDVTRLGREVAALPEREA